MAADLPDFISDPHVYKLGDKLPFDHPQWGRENVIVDYPTGTLEGHGSVEFARKAFKVASSLDNADLVNDKAKFKNELKVLGHAQSHHVIRILEAYFFESGPDDEEESYAAIVMDKAQDFDKVVHGHKIGKAQVYEWFGCLARALAHIHEIGIRHRDIKPQNILVKEKKVLLADFGISKMVLGKTLSTTTPGNPRAATLDFCAPEVQYGSSRSYSADVFSLGVVFLEMLAALREGGRADLQDTKSDQTKSSYAENLSATHRLIDKWKEERDSNFKYLQLCQSMLDADHGRRPDAVMVLDSISSIQVPNPVEPPCECSAPSKTDRDQLLQYCKTGKTEPPPLEHLKATKGAIQQASKYGHDTVITLLLNAGFDINLQDYSGQTALHCAAGYGKLKAVKLLLEERAKPDLQDLDGRTALHYAAGHGDTEIVRTLLNADSINSKDTKHRTALHFAAARGHLDIVNMLLCFQPQENKYYINSKDIEGWTPLHLAAGYGSLQVVQSLLNGGARSGLKASDKKWTALHCAVYGLQEPGEYDAIIRRLMGSTKAKFCLDLACRSEECECEQNGRKRTICQWVDQQLDRGIGYGRSKPLESAKGNGNILAGFHPDFISFVTIAQYHHIDIWPMSWDDKLNKLGSGATGDVKQSMVDLKAHFALKRFESHRATRQHDSSSITSSTLSENEALFTALISDSVILRQPQIEEHAHIVGIQGIAFEVEGGCQGLPGIWPMLIMEKAQEGDLARYLASERGREASLSARLEFLDIVHGDIKPQNILVYRHGDKVTAKVTDFSYSCLGKSGNDIVHLPRSRPWHAPEYSHEGFKICDAKLMDIYSFGMVCFWVLFPQNFREIVNCQHSEGMEEALLNIQTTAEQLATGAELLEPSRRDFLARFFRVTLCQAPQGRNQNWQELVQLLGQELWKPADEDILVDGTSGLKLSDYRATPDEIEDPQKRRGLINRILSSLRLTGTDYDTMQQFFDSPIFADKQLPESTLAKVVEGLGLFAVSSPVKDGQMNAELTHNCINTRATGSCEQCASSASFELAFCYTLGFGVHSNDTETQEWLSKSGASPSKLNGRLERLKKLTISDIEYTTHLESGTRGFFSFDVWARYGSGNFDSAEAHLSREIHDLEKHLGTDNWQIFDLKAELIHLLSAQKKTDEATKMCEALKACMQEKHGTSHPLHVRAELFLADFYREQNRWDEAENLLLEAKNILVELAPEHQLTIHACEELASIFAERGKAREAEKEFAQVLKVVKETLHADHQFASRMTERYADFLEKQGEVTEAGELRNQQIRESDAARKVAQLFTEHNRGRESMLEGKLDQAEEILSNVKQKAEMRAKSEALDADKFKFKRAAMMATRNLALVVRRQGRFAEAETLQRELKKRIEMEAGQPDRETLNVTFDLARTLQMQMNWVEAEEMQLIVKGGRSALLGPTHEDTVNASKNLVEIYRKQNKEHEAENEMKTVRSACEERLGLCHRDTLKAIRELATMYLLSGKLELAEEELVTVVSISLGIFGPYTEETLSAKSNLGLVYIAQGRLAKAEELLKGTLEDMRKHLGHEHQFTTKTIEHLARVYGQQGKIQEKNELTGCAWLPGPQQQIHFRPLSEDEQIQIALELSLQTQHKASESRIEDNEDTDLQRAIAISLEKEDEEPIPRDTH
ncbi:hypothetical protein FGADI_9541 [Fusarium gaditjirri]|uniref:Protein kinase domain-containing protein n=1 Tax=Fusarium gaditjirri TaxID=282569 RepID=A0A8H4SZH1_9HYPO|nr:hypothetical protein FGADI_9541 [Fusarium gaditjirri]